MGATAISGSEPVIWLRDEGAGLGPYSARHVDQHWQWATDPAVLIGCGSHVPVALEARREGYQPQARGSGSLRFTVWDLTKDEPAPVGATAIQFDPEVRAGEFFILLGTVEARGRGLGTEATRLTLDYAFHVANLACVHLTVKAPNTRAIRAYEAAGFRWVGQRRNSAYWFGQRCDEVLMDCVPADYAGTSGFRSLFYGPPKADT